MIVKEFPSLAIYNVEESLYGYLPPCNILSRFELKLVDLHVSEISCYYLRIVKFN
jgi:hypothetical protein